MLISNTSVWMPDVPELARERRRYKNREVMRRIRERQLALRSSLENTLKSLKSQYDSLLSQAAVIPSQQWIQQQTNANLRRYRALRASCDQLADTARELRQERFWLRKAIRTHAAVAKAVQQQMNDPCRREFHWVNDVIPFLPAFEDTDFGELAQLARREVTSILTNNLQLASRTTTERFGWREEWSTREGQRQFHLTKGFAESTAALTQRAWSMVTREVDVEALRGRTLAVKVLTRIDENTIIVARQDDFAQDKRVYCCLCLVARVRTAKGWMVIVRSLEPTSKYAKELMTELLEPEAIVFVQACYAMVFSCTSSGGLDNSSVQVVGEIRSDSNSYVHSWMLDLVFAVWRWEVRSVSPMILLK